MMRTIHSIFMIFLIMAAGCMPAKDMLPWEDYSPEVLAEAEKSGQPVIIDFFADWCMPCHDLEHYTYSNPEVKEELMRFRRIKVDVTNPADPNIQEIAERFAVEGVPTIVFLDAKGNPVPEARISGFVPPREMTLILRSSRFMGTEQNQA